MTRLLGIDAGSARTGLAIGDNETRIATPLAIIEVRERGRAWLAREIVRRARALGAEGFVVGLPLNMDGSYGQQARSAEKLGAALATESCLPVAFWDERLSSFVAEQRLADAPRRRSRQVDDVAAAVILQSYFDRQGAEGGSCR
jgi:putative holliday junction resolvase